MDNNTQKNENPNNNEPIILGTLKKEKSSNSHDLKNQNFKVKGRSL